MSPAPTVHVSPGAAHLSPEVLRLLDRWLPEQRWYPVPAEGVTHQPWLTVTFGGVADVVVALLRLAGPGLAAGDESLVIQVPLVLTPTAEPEADTAETEAAGLIGTVTTASGRVTVHDGGVHPAAWHAYFTAALPGACEPEDCAELAGARRISGEQSNTSVVLPALPHATGRGGMLKILRTVALGPHPDVVIPAALTEAGWDGVPRYLGSVELPADGPGAPGAPAGSGAPGAAEAAGDAPARAHLAVLSELVHEATDGFELACAYAARDEDFGERALELGAVVAHLHTALREALGRGPALEPAGFMGVLRRRAAEAFADVPALAPQRAGVTALYDSLSARLSAVVDGGGVVALQAIHGDLHLGQALWSPDGWKVLDFEGEPQRPVSERTAPDLPLRDVAGLLRSLDYAAAVGHATDPQWVSHAQISFLEGYREAQSRVGAEERGTRPERSAAGSRPEGGEGYRQAGGEDQGTPLAPEEVATSGTVLDVGTAELMLRALTVDKALYEVVYEFRHRPAWMHIPLAAVERVLA
ncbi:maltokinase N-terminal cap-like domain-containing protein [Promicromonospora sukumoe]|uniref:maltokinase N-terminal cap-like domain-containing protein n=1 Tax=Promicromonospora sukumoe TaxID=88382 RepID=UPI000382CE3F|nr:phosphotransferase [Promicromonospora sukumoe]